MALKAQLSWFACVNGSPDLPPCVLLFGCFVKGSFNTQRGVKNLIGQFGVLHPLHPQCGCSSEKMCEQRTWTVCCFLLGPKPITLVSIVSGVLFCGKPQRAACGCCVAGVALCGPGRATGTPPDSLHSQLNPCSDRAQDNPRKQFEPAATLRLSLKTSESPPKTIPENGKPEVQKLAKPICATDPQVRVEPRPNSKPP